MMAYLKDNNLPVSALADMVGAKPASVHAWVWRDTRPSQELRPLLAEIIGGSPNDWDTPEEKRARAQALARVRRQREQRKAS